MTHQWHDTYRHKITPAHHLDPRSKLFIGMLYVGCVLLTPRFTVYQAIGYPSIVVLAAVLAGVSFKPLVGRFFTILPFALLMGLSTWFSHLPKERVLDVLGRALCSIAAMSLLILTTPFPDLLRAL